MGIVMMLIMTVVAPAVISQHMESYHCTVICRLYIDSVYTWTVIFTLHIYECFPFVYWQTIQKCTNYYVASVGKGQRSTGSRWGNLKEKHQVENIGVYWRIILKLTLKKQHGMAWRGLDWVHMAQDRDKSRAPANAVVKVFWNYKVVQIWPGQTVTCLHTNRPGHIWTTLYLLCVFSLIYSLIKQNKRIYDIQKSTVFQFYLFRQVCAILREFTHQI